VEILVKIAIEVLRLIPMILAFYIPALLGVAIWREKGEAYQIKAALMFVVGFGALTAVHVMLRSVSALQVAGVIGLSLVQILAAMVLAALTVYKLAD
jgi:hypothetical protein